MPGDAMTSGEPPLFSWELGQRPAYPSRSGSDARTETVLAGLFGDNAKLLHAMQQRCAGQSEANGGAAMAAHNPIHLPEHFENMSALGVLQRAVAAGLGASATSLRSPKGAHNTGPGERITERSMKFCSSRMLPGQL